MGFVLYMIAGTLAATRPEAAAIIQGAAETYVVQSPMVARLVNYSTVTEALGEERAQQSAPAARTWAGTRPSPTPSPRPPRPSANSNLRPSHERAAASRRGYCLCERPVVPGDRGGHRLGLTCRIRLTGPLEIARLSPRLRLRR